MVRASDALVPMGACSIAALVGGFLDLLHPLWIGGADQMVAGHTDRDQVVDGVVVRVSVRVMDDEIPSISIAARPGCAPVDLPVTPLASMRTRADRFVQD